MNDSDPDTSVDAVMAPTPDVAGYLWVDSKSPEPKASFDWIDAKVGTKVSLTGDDVYTTVNIPFSFPFYENYYSICYPSTNGFIGLQQATNSLGGNIPSTSPTGFIAPWWDDTGIMYGEAAMYSTTGKNEYGVNYFVIEWYKISCPYYSSGSSYEITYEVIMYEDGTIKLQYLDATSSTYGNGASATVGIDGPVNGGLQYSNNAPNIQDGMAIIFGNSIVEIESIEADTDEGGALYALSRDYVIKTTLKHPISSDMVKQTSITLGNGLTQLICRLESGTPIFTYNDPNKYIELALSKCRATKDGKYLSLQFAFSPTFNYPTTEYQDLVVSTGGIGVMPNSQVITDLFWVETKLDLLGAMYAYSEARGIIENGGWVHGNEEFNFMGVRAVYPGTMMSPRLGAITFTISDENGIMWVQENVEGNCNVPVISENDYIRKTYVLNITNVPPGTDVAEKVPYILNVDPFRPMPPKDVLIHSDSYDDRNTAYDDDNEVYVSWEPAEDYESGIGGYYVATYDPLETGETETRAGAAVYVISPDTSAVIVFDGDGVRKVWVWAVDKAGNPSIPTYAVTKIDREELTYSEFSPGNGVWVNTHTPFCSVLIDDHGGSGVSAKDVQYSVSTTNLQEYGAWMAGGVSRDMDQLRLSVKTNFVNGKTNYIRFQARDVAGNGWTVSEDYNVWVDEEVPLYVNFRPYETEYQSGETVVVSVDITDLHGSREGSGIRMDTVEYRYSVGGLGLFGDWEEATISSVGMTGVVHIEMELRFREGVQNYIQFRSYDNVGNFAQSKEFNIKVNAAPVVEAYMSEPRNGLKYTSEEKILFDASGTTDPDGDELSYVWYSDINGFLSGTGTFFRALSPGVHVITLVVNDPAHSVVRYYDIEVLEETQIDPELTDSDGDGLYDAWEERYGLNPERPDSFIDSDHDTFTNYMEYQNGTDPTNANIHPPYPVLRGEEDDGGKSDEEADQYRSVTLGVLLLGFVLVLVLVMLAYSRRRVFRMEVEEEREVEGDEAEYRAALETRKAEKINKGKGNK